VGGAGEEGASSALNICLIKSELHLQYHQKLIANDVFKENPETKKFAETFCKAFF
jgi:hypothetical protein